MDLGSHGIAMDIIYNPFLFFLDIKKKAPIKKYQKHGGCRDETRYFGTIWGIHVFFPMSFSILWGFCKLE